MSRTYSVIRHEMKMIEQSFHVKAYVKMRELSLSFHTFKKNYQLFQQHLKTNNDIDYHSQFEYKPLRWEYHSLQKETYRLLLNFVASAISLVEHTRNIVKHVYTGLEFQKEYQDKINEILKNNPVNKFVRDFRNYVLHNKFPFVGVQFQLKRISPIGDLENLCATTVKLTLNKKELLSSTIWTAPSRNYLESQDELIFLDALIEEYYLLIDGFHSWLNKRQLEMHNSEYSWLLEKWEELYQELDIAITAQR